MLLSLLGESIHSFFFLFVCVCVCLSVQSTVQIGTGGDALKSAGGGMVVTNQEKSRIKHPTPSGPGGGSPINKVS